MSNPVGWLNIAGAHRITCGTPAQSYDAFLNHLTIWAEANTIPCVGVRVGTINCPVAGSVKAEKVAVITAARALGFDPKGDNEADTLALLDRGLSCAGRR